MNIKDFINSEVKKIHKKNLLESELHGINKKLSLLSENEEAAPYNSNTYENYKKDLEEIVKSLADACNKLESSVLKQEQHINKLPKLDTRIEEGKRHKDVIVDIYKEIKTAKLKAEKKLYEMD